MKFPKLYSRSSLGKIQEWSMEIEGDKYRTIAGQQNGQQTISEWTIAKAKNIGKANETSGKEQARLECESKYRKQLAQGGYKENIKDVDKEEFFSCMLAKSYDDRKDKVVFPPGVYSQPKLDGIRCMISSKGAFTRNGKEILTVEHIKNVFAKTFEKYGDELIWDGEIYSHAFKNDFNKIASLTKKLKPTPEDLAESANLIQYWCYDCYLDKTDTFSVRHGFIKEVIKGDTFNIVKVVETTHCKSQKELDKCYENYMADGYEGQMIRFDKPYENKRSSWLLKRKEFMDEEFEILDILEGEGNKSGMAGAMVFKTKEGKDFNSNIKGTWEYCGELLKNKGNYIGKLATVKYFNLTPDLIPRFPYVIKVDREGE